MIVSLTTLTYLIFHNKLVTSLLMEDISDVKYQLHNLHFEEYFIQQKKGTQSPTFMLELMY